jgi:hypothetical protein
MVKNIPLSNKECAFQSRESFPHILPAWLVKFCASSRMMWLGPIIGFILCIPSFFTGYQLDDHLLLQQSIDKSAYHHRAAWDYFNWVSSDAETKNCREKGINIVDWLTPNAFRHHMFHPIPSLIHAFQLRFFGNAPWLMHICQALFYILLIFLCGKLLLRFSSSLVAIGIGILLFAIDDTHSMSTCWISALNTLLCCVFGLFALLMHDRWRSKKSAGALLLFIAAFLLALFSSEGGLALCGYLIAYALFMETGTLWKKAASLLPAISIALGYVLFYISHHFGARCSMSYISPGDTPWLAVKSVLGNTVLFSLSQVLSLPPLAPVLQLLGLLGVIIALILLAILVFIFRKFLLSTPTIAFFSVGMILSIVPFTVGLMSDRLLLWAGFGAAGLMGELFAGKSAQTGKAQRILAKILAFCNIVISIIFFVPSLFFYIAFADCAGSLEKIVPRDDTILLNASNKIAFLYAAAIRYEKSGDWPQHFYYLYSGEDTLKVKRVDYKAILATTSKGWYASVFERPRRSKQLYFKPGDTFNLELMSATIQKVTPDGRPQSVQFTFKKDLSEYAWLKWAKKEPERCSVPAIGEEISLFVPMF